MTKTSLLSRRELVLIFVIAIGLSFFVFGNVIRGQFVYDDDWVISRNPTLQQVNKIPAQFISPYHYLQPETGLYRPLTLISFSLNFILGKGPASFHVVNIFLHALNSFLVFLLLFYLFKSRKLAYIGSLLFLLMPIHTEAVSSIIGRADILAFFFSLIVLLLIYHKKYWWSTCAFFLALLSKESAIGLVPIIVFLFWFLENGGIANVVKKSLRFIPAGAVYLVLRYIALRSNFLSNDADLIYNPLKFAHQPAQFFSALKVMFMYLWKTFVPTHLSADYSFNQIPLVNNLANPYVIGGLALIVAILALLFWRRTARSPLTFGGLFFLSTFFVVSNFIFPIGTVMAERMFYMPSLGIAIITAYPFSVLTQRRFKFFWWLILIMAFLIYSISIINRNRVWLNEEALFKDMAEKSPFSAHAKTNLGIYYIQEQGKWGEGESLIEESYKIAPEHIPTMNTLGIIAKHKGDLKLAEERFKEAIRLNKNALNAYVNLGKLYLKQGRYEEAGQNFLKVIESYPVDEYVIRYAYIQITLNKPDIALETIGKYYGDRVMNSGELSAIAGTAYFVKKDYQKALDYLSIAKAQGKDDPEIESMINISKQKLGIK